MTDPVATLRQMFLAPEFVRRSALEANLDEALVQAKAQGAEEAVARIRGWATARIESTNRVGRVAALWTLLPYLDGEDERESSLGRDAEGHLILSMGPGAERRRAERDDR